jgi:AhpD family alkylhydroperoxidase
VPVCCAASSAYSAWLSSHSAWLSRREQIDERSTGQRLSVNEVDPSAYQAVLGLERYVRSSGLEKPLCELIKIRASQLNGCAFCLDMHHRDARAGGEDQRRLDVLSAWREAPELYTARERAALALTEAVTLIGRDGVPDDVWTGTRQHFDEAETVHLLMGIATTTVWNRLAVSTHQQLPDPRPEPQPRAKSSRQDSGPRSR